MEQQSSTWQHASLDSDCDGYHPDLAVTTGLRLGELLGQSWDDVDLKAGRLSVLLTLQRLKGQGLVLKDFPKTKSGFRAVALPPLTVQALRRHRVEQRQ